MAYPAPRPSIATYQPVSSYPATTIHQSPRWQDSATSVITQTQAKSTTEKVFQFKIAESPVVILKQPENNSSLFHALIECFTNKDIIPPQVEGELTPQSLRAIASEWMLAHAKDPVLQSHIDFSITNFADSHSQKKRAVLRAFQATVINEDGSHNYENYARYASRPNSPTSLAEVYALSQALDISFEIFKRQPDSSLLESCHSFDAASKDTLTIQLLFTPVGTQFDLILQQLSWQERAMSIIRKLPERSCDLCFLCCEAMFVRRPFDPALDSVDFMKAFAQRASGLQPIDFAPQPVDGNCLFHSIAEGLNRKGIRPTQIEGSVSHETLRELAVAWMIQNIDNEDLQECIESAITDVERANYRNGNIAQFSSDAYNMDGSVNHLAYVQHMSSPGFFGNGPELFALSHACNVSIRIFCHDRATSTVSIFTHFQPQEPSTSPVIDLLFSPSRCHYDLITKQTLVTNQPAPAADMTA